MGTISRAGTGTILDMTFKKNQGRYLALKKIRYEC